MIIIIILSVLLAISLAGNVYITRLALKINNTAHVGVLAVEECLDSINLSYGIVGKILQLPLASNDSKVIQIHKELKRVHGNLLVVANKLAQSWNNTEEGKVSVSDTNQE